MNRDSVTARRQEIVLAFSKGAASSLVACLLFIIPPVVHSATFNCPSGDVDCLVAAITAATTNGVDDEIVLEAGTYTLTQPNNDDECGPTESADAQGLPIIADNASLVIRSENAIIQRDAAAPPFRIFCVRGPGDAHLTLEGITVRGGRAPGAGEFGEDTYGGGLLAMGNSRVTLIKSTVTENIADWGGGIFWSGPELNVVGSTINNNQGGGIINEANVGIMRVVDSAIFGNKRVVGEDDYCDSAGIVTESELVVINSTVSDNEGPGVALWSGRDWSITNATITRNGYGDYVGGEIAGGIFNWARVGNVRILKNTIVADNSGRADCEWNVQLESAGNNIIGDATGCDIVLQPSDFVGDPGLDSLVDNGKPGYGHYPLHSGSPAIDAGDDTECSSADQIGNSRHDGDGDGTVVCDIGAIEYQGEYYEVAIDVKPGNSQNVVNPRKQGRFWLAILSDNEVDATQVDPSSVALGVGEAAADGYRIRDVNRDRVPDLLLRFRMPAVGIVCGDTTLELIGETYAGDLVHGTDAIRTVGCKANGGKSKKK